MKKNNNNKKKEQIVTHTKTKFLEVTNMIKILTDFKLQFI